MGKILRIRENSINMVLLMMCILLLVAKAYVSWQYRAGERFAWDARATTAYGLPVMVAECDFRHGNYQGNGCEDHYILHGDSTAPEQLSCGGSDYNHKELYPDSLHLLYYSFKEQQFWGGSFPLPYEKIKKSAAQLRRQVQKTYGNGATQEVDFTAELHAGGEIVVVLASSYSQEDTRIEIGRYKAHREAHDWSVFNNEHAQQVSQSTSVAVQRALITDKYNWLPDISLPDNAKLNRLEFETFWQKGIDIDSTQRLDTTADGIGHLPYSLDVTWRRGDTIEYYTSFYFEENALVKAFRALDTPGGKRPIILMVTAKEDTAALRVELRADKQVIPMKNLYESHEIGTRKLNE